VRYPIPALLAAGLTLFAVTLFVVTPYGEPHKAYFYLPDGGMPPWLGPATYYYYLPCECPAFKAGMWCYGAPCPRVVKVGERCFCLDMYYTAMAPEALRPAGPGTLVAVEPINGTRVERVTVRLWLNETWRFYDCSGTYYAVAEGPVWLLWPRTVSPSTIAYIETRCARLSGPAVDSMPPGRGGLVARRIMVFPGWSAFGWLERGVPGYVIYDASGRWNYVEPGAESYIAPLYGKNCACQVPCPPNPVVCDELHVGFFYTVLIPADPPPKALNPVLYAQLLPGPAGSCPASFTDAYGNNWTLSGTPAECRKGARAVLAWYGGTDRLLPGAYAYRRDSDVTVALNVDGNATLFAARNCRAYDDTGKEYRGSVCYLTLTRVTASAKFADLATARPAELVWRHAPPVGTYSRNCSLAEAWANPGKCLMTECYTPIADISASPPFYRVALYRIETNALDYFSRLYPADVVIAGRTLLEVAADADRIEAVDVEYMPAYALNERAYVYIAVGGPGTVHVS